MSRGHVLPFFLNDSRQVPPTLCRYIMPRLCFPPRLSPFFKLSCAESSLDKRPIFPSFGVRDLADAPPRTSTSTLLYVYTIPSGVASEPFSFRPIRDALSITLFRGYTLPFPDHRFCPVPFLHSSRPLARFETFLTLPSIEPLSLLSLGRLTAPVDSACLFPPPRPSLKVMAMTSFPHSQGGCTIRFDYLVHGFIFPLFPFRPEMPFANGRDCPPIRLMVNIPPARIYPLHRADNSRAPRHLESRPFFPVRMRDRNRCLRPPPLPCSNRPHAEMVCPGCFFIICAAAGPFF